MKWIFSIIFILAVIIMVTASPAHAERITFEDLTISDTYESSGVFFTSPDGDLFVPASIEGETDGQGLSGQSSGHKDLMLNFENGATGYLSFEFFLTTQPEDDFGYVYIGLFDNEGFPVTSPVSVYAYEIFSVNGLYFQRGNVDITFPGTAKTAMLNFTTTGGNNYIMDNLMGNFGTYEPPEEEPYISATPESLDFGDVPEGSSSIPQEVTISNIGSGNLELGSLSITGENPSEFSLQDDGCSQQTLAPGEICDLKVIFSPATEGTKSAILSIPSNAINEDILNIPLNGGIQEDLVRIDSLVIKDYYGKELCHAINLYEPVLATLTFRVMDQDNDGIIRINGEECFLPLDLKLTLKGLEQKYHRRIKMGTGTHYMTECFFPTPEFCESYAYSQNLDLPLNADVQIRGKIVLKKMFPGVGGVKIFQDKIYESLILNCGGYW